jgi:hypothetical protein
LRNLVKDCGYDALADEMVRDQIISRWYVPLNSTSLQIALIFLFAIRRFHCTSKQILRITQICTSSGLFLQMHRSATSPLGQQLAHCG